MWRAMEQKFNYSTFFLKFSLSTKHKTKHNAYSYLNKDARVESYFLT